MLAVFAMESSLLGLYREKSVLRVCYGIFERGEIKTP